MAYDWAKEKTNWLFDFLRAQNYLKQFTFVLFAEFRNLKQGCKFKSVFDLALYAMEQTRIFSSSQCQELKTLISSESFQKQNKILILLDGYDEMKSSCQCQELEQCLSPNYALSRKQFCHVILSTRPGHIEFGGAFEKAKLLGFSTFEQKERYINAHFSNLPKEKSQEEIGLVREKLKNSSEFQKMAESPLLLMFLCLIHRDLREMSQFELYRCFIWYLLDRYQKDHPEINVPAEFGCQNDKTDFRNCVELIKTRLNEFLLLKIVSRMALLRNKEQNFSASLAFDKYKIPRIAVDVGILLESDGKQGKTYSFLHRNLQDFFACAMAFWWADYEGLFGHFNFDKSDLLQSQTRIYQPRYSELRKFLYQLSIDSKFDVISEMADFFGNLSEMELNFLEFADFEGEKQLLAVKNILLSCRSLKSLKLSSWNRKFSASGEKLKEKRETQIGGSNLTWSVRNTDPPTIFEDRNEQLEYIVLSFCHFQGFPSFVQTIGQFKKKLNFDCKFTFAASQLIPNPENFVSPFSLLIYSYNQKLEQISSAVQKQEKVFLDRNIQNVIGLSDSLEMLSWVNGTIFITPTTLNKRGELLKTLQIPCSLNALALGLHRVGISSECTERIEIENGGLSKLETFEFSYCSFKDETLLRRFLNEILLAVSGLKRFRFRYKSEEETKNNDPLVTKVFAENFSIYEKSQIGYYGSGGDPDCITFARRQH